MRQIQKYRNSILFLVGAAIIVAAVVNGLIRNTSVLPGMVVLGTTLCGVGVLQTKDGANGK